MKIQTIWYLICLVFAFQSLEILFEESYEVVYAKSNRTESVLFLACAKLSDLYPNETEIDLKKLQDDLYKLLNSSIQDLRKRGNVKKIEEWVLNRIKSGGYLVLNEMICLFANSNEELKIIIPFFPAPKKLFAISRNTFELVKMSGWSDAIDSLTVLKKDHPYFDCSRKPRFRCLNECFRSKFRLAKYLYESDETGFILLNYSDTNRTIAESERTCFGKCKTENCKLVQLISAHILKQSKFETFEAQPKLSAFDYWVQLVGLLCCFTGLSLNEFASVAIEFVQSKVRRRKLRIALFCLKLAIFLFGLASFSYLCTRMVLGHKSEWDNPKEKEVTRHLVQPKIFYLAICVHFTKKYVPSWRNGRTMEEIERATERALDDVLEGIYVDYGRRSFPTDYHVHPKKLFKFFFRCFPLSIHPNYQTIPSSPKLRIKFKEGINHQLYLLTENETFNENSFWFMGRFAFEKRIVKRLRSKGKCLDHNETNCTRRQNWLEKCTSRKFKGKYGKITGGSINHQRVIDRDWFSPSEWNTSQLIVFPYDNQSLYEPIREECLEGTLDKKPCEEARFEATVEISKLVRNLEEIFIDLQFDVVRSVEEEPSSYKLLLNIASIQGIIFGLTALSILQMISSLVQTTLRVRANKLIRFLLYLLSSFGAIWHTYHILHLVVSGELVPTEHYELVKRVQMPALVFCFHIDEKLMDRNHQMTGNYLEKLTKQMTTERTFKSITYLNGSNEWTPFSHSRAKRFFFFNMKCFKIEINQEYDRDQFHFSTKRQMLKVNFMKTPDKEKNFVHFMTKQKETEGFSKIVHLKYSTRSSITHEISLYKYEDRFSFIRRYFYSFQEEKASNLQELLLELQDNKYRLRTLNLPLEKEAFRMEVDEDLFEQLYKSSVEKSRNKLIDLNYQQQFVDNHLREDKQLESDFAFTVIFLQKVVSSTNEENLGQLILGLLNVLFIWFDLGVLDLHSIFEHCHLLIYLYLHLPAFVCRRLKQLESLLNERLNHRQPIRRRVRRF